MIGWAVLAGVLLVVSAVLVVLLTRTLSAVRAIDVEMVEMGELRAALARLRADVTTWRDTAKGLRRRSGATTP